MQKQRHPMLEQSLALARSGRLAEGMALLKRLAKKGEPEALFLLAETTWVGGPVPQDIVRGRILFRRGSEAGHEKAHMAYTNLLASGIAGKRDWPAALTRLRDEARTDSGRAQVLARIEAMDLDDAGDPANLPAPNRLSDSPAVTLYPGAFTAGECAFLLEIADNWKPCLVSDGMGGNVQDPIRTAEGSTTHWLIEDPAVHALNRRLAGLSATTTEQGEPLQLLRYRPGQQYRPHVDWDGDDGNGRIKTALVYLNEVYEGGETLFVKTGLKVKGRTGDVLVFSSEDETGAFDPMSEHAGLPVTSGVKYLASRWIHKYPFKT